MKGMLKTLSICALVGIMMLSLAACGNNAVPEDASDVPGTEENSDFDFSAYPGDLGSWTINDMQTYLKDCGLLGNEAFLLVAMSETDVTPIHAAGGFMYMDAEAASVADIVYAFDPADADSQAALKSVVENKAIMMDGNPVAQMDAVLGHFAFSYLNGTDDAHIDSFTQAIVNLGAYYGVEPDYLPET